MVKALAHAIEMAEKLPAAEQEALAAILEAEIADEAAWQKKFAETPKTIESLVDRAKRQYRQGDFESF